MKHRADMPVYVNGTLIGHLIFTKFGVRPILLTSELLGNFTDETSATNALKECAVLDSFDAVIGFISGKEAWIIDSQEKANSWTGRLRQIGSFSIRNEAVSTLRRMAGEAAA